MNSLVISEPLPFSLPHDIPLPITQPPSNPLTLCTHSHTVERVCQGWQRHDGGRFFGPLRKKKNNYSCFHASDWKLFSPDYFYHPSFLPSFLSLFSFFFKHHRCFLNAFFNETALETFYKFDGRRKKVTVNRSD